MKGLWTVFYVKEPRWFGRETVPTAETFGTLYVAVKKVMAEGVEEVFEKMQGENWSPNGEARPMIEALGLTHTSMSVGDVTEGPNGELQMVEVFGWKTLEFKRGGAA